MLKRTLVFSSPMILSLKNLQIVVAYKDSPDEKRTIPIEDVGVVLLLPRRNGRTLLCFGKTWRKMDLPCINLVYI